MSYWIGLRFLLFAFRHLNLFQLSVEIFYFFFKIFYNPFRQQNLLRDPVIPRELLRAPPSLDLLAMHCPAIRDFFRRSVSAHQPLSQVLDCTDLLLPLDISPPQFGSNDGPPLGLPRIASAHPAIRYIGRENATTLEKGEESRLMFSLFNSKI